MGEKKFDQALNIWTEGLREWRDPSVQYNRYEATPYKALEHFFNHYKLRPSDHVVDFGSGRGRVAFYIHHRFQIPVTGIEVNEQTLDEAISNKLSYRRKAAHIDAPIRFEYGLAEQFNILPEHNKFYFFNPFTVQIFKKVIHNIVKSVEAAPRQADIILYYPLPEYKRVLHQNTPFRLVNKIRVPGAKDKLEKFLVYRVDSLADEMFRRDL